MSRLELVLVSAIEMKRAKKPRTIMRPHFKMLPKKKNIFQVTGSGSSDYIIFSKIKGC